MFTRNTSTFLNTVIDPDYIRILNEKDKSDINNSIYSFIFYNVVYQVNENNFKSLYSKFKGTYNAPINVLVGAIILKDYFKISIEQLLDGIKYNIGFKYALGLTSISDKPFCRATFFNFNKSLAQFAIENPTLDHPLDLVRQNLTKAQIKQYGISTDIQRIDSVRLQSNIRKYSRLQLLVECLQRFLKVLDKEDLIACEGLVANFTSQTSEHLMYTLASEEVPQKIRDFGNVAQTLLRNFKNKYKTNKSFKLFETVFNQHFKIGKDNGFVYAIADDQLKGSNIQSPDDIDVSYGSKGKVGDTSYSASVSETCHPDNKVNLITSCIVVKNIVTDSEVFPIQLAEILSTTPNISELHTDAAYGSAQSDIICEAHQINHVQTAIKGVVPAVELLVEAIRQVIPTEDGAQLDGLITSYKVECPHQEAKVVLLKKRYKASFNLTICMTCKLQENCSSFKNEGVLMIDQQFYLKNKRQRSVRKLPKVRQKLRNNVESLMKSVKEMTLNKKLRIRGQINTAKAVCSRLIAINIGRLFRYVSSKEYINANIG